MGRNLPPLNALRAFEAAARHLSFTKAAEELHVTPAAVSHQIKGLEAQLGVPLFRRLTRALRLTEAGQAAFPKMRDGFDRLAEGVELLKAHEDDDSLTVSVSPSFGAKWLVPRLESLRTAHPDIDVRIDATDRLADFQGDGVDVALRYGPGNYPGLRVDKLFVQEMAPVCSPKLLEGEHPLKVPEDLRHHTLLHLDWTREAEAAPNWRMWLLAAGVDNVGPGGVDPARGPRFSMDSLALQAAIDGQGVALTSSILTAGDLEAGRLVVPFDVSVCDPMDFAYYVISPERTAEQPKVAAFRAWVLGEAGAEDEAESN
jgi:LysR family glycine cleavage system transcriptional activator